MFDQDTLTAITAIAHGLGVEAAALAAVVAVESDGVTFALIDGRQEPLIRWEGHYFDRRLHGAALSKARAEKLASPVVGGIPNPKSQEARWKLLERALAIDAEAAYESCSWGVGQVMGANWLDFKFNSVSELVNLARRDVAGQIELMWKFIVHNGLTRPLAGRDWAAFARVYNGPGYAANDYVRRMAAAYIYWSKALAGSDATPATLRFGDKGKAVEDLQRRLKARGAAIAVDGHFGPRTETAVRVAQKMLGLDGDGIVGPKTWAALTST